MSPVSFSMEKDAKKALAVEMAAAGNTNNLLYKLCTLNLSEVTVEPIKTVPEWFQNKIFEQEIPTPPFEIMQPLTADQDSFYTENIWVNKEHRKNICIATIDQAKCQVWRSERRKRITGTRAHPILRARTEEKKIEYFKNVKSLQNIDSVQFGIDHEDKARDSFSQLYDVDVVQVFFNK